jgi:hypothetical protein
LPASCPRQQFAPGAASSASGGHEAHRWFFLCGWDSATGHPDTLADSCGFARFGNRTLWRKWFVSVSGCFFVERRGKLPKCPSVRFEGGGVCACTFFGDDASLSLYLRSYLYESGTIPPPCNWTSGHFGGFLRVCEIINWTPERIILHGNLPLCPVAFSWKAAELC